MGDFGLPIVESWIIVFVLRLFLRRFINGNAGLSRSIVIDKRIVGPVCEAVKDFSEPVAIAVLPDHPTPCRHRTHTSEPVPFLIYYKGIEPDSVKSFDEYSCRKGSYHLLHGRQFIEEFMKH